LKRQATIIDGLRRLTDALAADGDSRSLRTGITTRAAEAVAEVWEPLLPDWRGALRHAPEDR
jgi:hypothetical protein